MNRYQIFARLIAAALFAVRFAIPAQAQSLEFEGSIFTLDPAALQSTDLEQIVGSDETTPLNQFDENDYYRVLAKPIGRLAVEFLNGKSAYCTASLIADDLLLTNAHCLLDSSGNNVARAGLLSMGYLTAGVTDGGEQFLVDMKRPVEVGFPGPDGKPDYAILRVETGQPGSRWGKVKLSVSAPGARSSLVVVHHPLGFPMVVSAGGECRSARASEADVYHLCDTQPGSSGAPVYSLGSSEVVALHYRKAGITENAAVRLDRLLAVSDTLRAIVAAYGDTQQEDTPEFDAGFVSVKPRLVRAGQVLNISAEAVSDCSPFFFDVSESGRFTPLPLDVFDVSEIRLGITRYENNAQSQLGFVVQAEDEVGIHRLGYICQPLGLKHDGVENVLRQLHREHADSLSGVITADDLSVVFNTMTYEILH